MALYNELLLENGGGITTSANKVPQASNAVNILIGIGGTGISALRTIKTQVYERLEPDDPNAIIPEYSRIRFIGIDQDRTAAGLYRRWNIIDMLTPQLCWGERNEQKRVG